MKRIVSLVPSSTETLLALGADVIACTKFCEQASIAHVGGTKNPDVAAIIALAPDLVVLDREENRLEDHDALVEAGLDVHVSDVTSLRAGVTVVTDLAERAAVTVPPPGIVGDPVGDERRRRAFVPIWRRPWMTISSETYGGSLLAHIGIDLVDMDDPVDTGDATAYPTVDLDHVASRRPDIVIVPSEPYVFDNGHLVEIAQAMPDAEIVRVDGQDLFWWGSRTPDAVSRLRGALALRSTH